MEKFKHILSNILTIAKSPTVEIPIFFGLGSQIISNILYQDLALYQGCKVDLKYPEEICDAISKSKAYNASEFENAEVEVHGLLSNINSSFSIVEYGLPIFIIFFLGPLSDIFGRKIPMMIAFAGFLLQGAGYLISSSFSSWSLWTLKLLIAFPRAMFGGEALYTMASIAYLSDITPNDMTLRTIRINIYTGVYIASSPIASLIAGQLSTLELENFYKFSISVSFLVIGAIFLLIFVPNTKTFDQTKLNHKKILNLIFEPNLTWMKNWKTLQRPRKGYAKLKIICLLISHFCIIAPQNAEYGVKYLFTKIQLGWNLLEYGNFSAFSTICCVVGILFTSGILAYWLKLSDPIIGFISGITQFSACFIYAFANTSLLMYLAGLVDFLNGSLVSLGKSILSKSVEQEELGSIVACIGILDTLSPLISVPAYAQFYVFTLPELPGAFYLLSAVLSIPGLVTFTTLVICGLIKSGTSPLRSVATKSNPEDKNLLKKVFHPNKRISENTLEQKMLGYGSFSFDHA